MKNICVIDLRVSNLKSVVNSLELVGYTVNTIDNWSSSQPIPSADIFLLPGVGSFDSGMANLKSSGLDKLVLALHKASRPLVGICLGMQLLLEGSDESTSSRPGLGLIKGFVHEIDSSFHKVPNIGWYRNVSSSNCSDLSTYLDNDFYFIHSFHCRVSSSIQISYISLSSSLTLTSAYYQSNILGLQFHPEKSHDAGLNLLNNLPLFFK